MTNPKKHFFAVATLIVVSTIIYFPNGYFFLNDDFTHVARVSLLDLNTLFYSYRPLHDLLLVIVKQFSNTNPIGYHLVLLLLHILATVLVYFFGIALQQRYQTNAYLQAFAFLSSLCFSVYPFHSESILWILGGGATLATIFSLLSLITFLNRERNKYLLFWSYISFGISLTAYESSWVIPALIFYTIALDHLLKKNHLKNQLFHVFIFSLILVLHLVFRKFVLGDLAGIYGSERLLHIQPRLWLYNYLCLVFRSFIPPFASSNLFVFFSAIIAITWGLLFFLKKILRKNALTIFFTFSFLIALIPVMPLGISTHSRESERFLYFPSVFVCFLIINVLTQLFRDKKFTIAVSIVLVYFSFKTIQNCLTYSTAGKIQQYTLKAIDSLSKKNDRLELSNLIWELNGIPVNRKGTKDGLLWLYNTDTNKVVFTDFIQLHSNKITFNNYITFIEITQEKINISDTSNSKSTSLFKGKIMYPFLKKTF